MASTPVTAVAISPDGRFAFSGSGSTIQLWYLVTGECLRTFERHKKKVTCVAISPDGRFVLSASEDKTLRLWEFRWLYHSLASTALDEGVRPYLEIFLTLHTPHDLEDIHRLGSPSRTEGDFKRLLVELGYRGYSRLWPQDVRRELEKMASSWQGPPPLKQSKLAQIWRKVMIRN